MRWKTLGAVSPDALVDARLQLHHAAQVVASAGVSFLEPQPDDSHPNFGWVESLGAFVGRVLPGADAHVGLRVGDLSLVLVGRDGEVRDEFDLSGRTLDEGYAWLVAETVRAGESVPREGSVRAAYEIPSHPVGNGAVFATAPGPAFAELGRWFSNGQRVLADLLVRTDGASELRCWPHHFDLGSLVVVATDADGGLAQSIGVGLSPGDDVYPEPYCYVSPWPYPDAGLLPPLAAGGHWHTEGYTSAILTGSDLVAGPPGSQVARLRAFLVESIDTSRRILSK